jgi:hypothetical protein
VASAHLSDFQEQFHTQTISTISFAVAQLPLQPPEATGKVARGRQTTPPAVRNRNTGPNPALPGRHTGPNPAISGRHTGPNPALQDRTSGPNQVVRPSPALDTMAPPTGAMEPVSAYELGPSDTIIGMAEQPGASGGRRRLLVISASASIMLVAGFGLWGFESKGRRTVSPPVLPTVQVIDPRVVPVDPAPIAPVPVAPRLTQPIPDEIEMTPDEPGDRTGSGKDVPIGVAQPHTLPHDPSHKPIRKDTRPPGAPPAAVFTREQLGQRFQQVRREYDDYKAKFGSRLEKEWGELTTYIQYMPASDDDTGRKDAARRLEAFRVRMRE